jgi:hypothetical protein
MEFENDSEEIAEPTIVKIAKHAGKTNTDPIPVETAKHLEPMNTLPVISPLPLCNDEKYYKEISSLKLEMESIISEAKSLKEQMEIMKLNQKKEVKNKRVLSSNDIKEIKQINENIINIIKDRNFREERNDFIFGFSLLLLCVFAVLYFLAFVNTNCGGDTDPDVFSCSDPILSR